MATKGLGIYVKEDFGRSRHMMAIFKNTGIAKADIALAEVTLAAAPKVRTTMKGNAGTVPRLQYRLHTRKAVRGTSDLRNFIAAGDSVHVVWSSHSQAYGDTGHSIKFLPLYGLASDDEGVLMSAKELARTIFQVLLEASPGPDRVTYPASLTIVSCKSGAGRADNHREAGDFSRSGGPPEPVWGRFKVSKSTNPLGLRVLDHLHAFYNPAPTTACTVSAPTDAVSGGEMSVLNVPPTGPNWVQATL